VTKACFPAEYAATKEGDAKEAKARVKELLVTSKDALLQVGLATSPVCQ